MNIKEKGPPIDPSLAFHYVVLAKYKGDVLVPIGPFASKQEADNWAKNRLPNHLFLPTEHWSVVFLHPPS